MINKIHLKVELSNFLPNRTPKEIKKDNLLNLFKKLKKEITQYGKKMISYLKKWWFLGIILPLVFSLIFFFLENYYCHLQTEELINLTTQQHKEEMKMTKQMLNICTQTLQQSPKFANYTCNPETKITKVCLNNPTIEDGTILIDECDSIYTPISFNEEGYRIMVKFKPQWNPDNKVHYLLDVSAGLENNRISLFTENNFLKMRVYQKDGTETTIKTRIDELGLNWKSDEWYNIEVRWFKPSGNIFLDVNHKTVAEDIIGEIHINLDQSKLFLGSDNKGGNQADGYFDYMGVVKYYPELKVYIGEEE